MKDKVKIIILILLLLATVLLTKILPLSTLNNINNAVNYIRQYKILAPLITILLIILQTNVPFVPFFVLAGANGIIFGFWAGTFINIFSALAGSSVNFYISRFLGKDWFYNHLSPENIARLEKVSLEKGFTTILLSRLIPVIPATLINVAAGISALTYTTFISSSALGKLPMIIFYTYLGNRLFKYMHLYQYFAYTLAILIVLYLIYLVVFKRSFFSARYGKVK